MSARSPRRAAVAVGAALLALSLGAIIAPAARSAPKQIGHRGAPSMHVIAAPSPVLVTDMRRHLVYEIVIDNTTRWQVRLDDLEVRDPFTRRVLSAYHDDAITGLMAGMRTPPTRTFAPDERDVLLLDVSLPAAQRAPARLEHRVVLTLSADGGRTRRVTITAATTRVDRRDPIRLSAPLRARGLAVANGCCSSASAHRRGLIEQDGRFVVAQRYAIDVVQVVDPLSVFAGDPARNDSHFV
jgi:hypothetical protein